MSASKENKTFRSFRYSFNQLSSDNTYRGYASNKNIFNSNKKLFQNDYTEDLMSSRPGKIRKSIDLEKSKKSIIIKHIYKVNNTISSKNLTQKFSLFRQNKDHVSEIFNNNLEKPIVNYYEGSTTNKDEKPKSYCTYTTPKIKKFKGRYGKNKIDEKEENKIEEEKISNNNLTEYYLENNSKVIKNFAYKEDENSNYRAYMEDKGVSVLNLNGDPDKALFCLFDGHGGDEVSTFLQNNFIKEFKEMLPFNDVKKNLINLFLKIDLKIKDLNYFEIGAAACIIYITKENGQRCAYSANVGDTRSILISKNKFKRLSYDHRADDSQEYKRIIKDGGIVFGGRVYGSLMLGRSFGDWHLKSHGVSCEPHITRINISDNDKYIILATDGIWDTLEESEVFDLSKNYDSNTKEFCNTLIYKAMKKGSKDNISCFVINL